MNMVFSTSDGFCLWFDSWRIDSGAQWALSIFIIFGMAMLREFVTMFRNSRLALRRSLRQAMKKASGGGELEPESVYVLFVDSFLYFIAVCLAYLLMLAIMTYNVQLCFATVLSLLFSNLYWTWFYKRQAYQIQKSARTSSTNDSQFKPTDADHCCDGIEDGFD